MDFDDVESDDCDLQEDGIVESGDNPEIFARVFSTEFEHLPDLERIFVRSFLKEIFTVSRNLETSVKSRKHDPRNLFHVVYHCLKDSLQLIVDSGANLFKRKSGQEFTLEIAFACLIFKAYLGAYKTSPKQYFRELEARSNQYLHYEFFPDRILLKAFDAVLENEEIMRQKELTTEWTRPAFRESPKLFLLLSDIQSRVFSSLLAQDKDTKSHENFTEKIMCNLTVDDLQLPGSGRTFKDSHMTVRRNPGKANKLGPHFNQISTSFLRIPIGVFEITRELQDWKLPREDLLKKILSTFRDRSGINASICVFHADRGYGVEVRILLKEGYHVICTMIKANPRNLFCRFAVAPVNGNWAEKNHRVIILPEGGRRTWIEVTMLGNREVYQIAYRDRPGKVVNFLTTLPDLPQRWVAMPASESDYTLAATPKEDNFKETLLKQMLEPVHNKTPKKKSGIRIQIDTPVAGLTTSSTAQTVGTSMYEPVACVFNKLCEGFRFGGVAQRTGLWRLFRLCRTTSTTVFTVLNIIDAKYASTLLTEGIANLASVLESITSTKHPLDFWKFLFKLKSVDSLKLPACLDAIKGKMIDKSSNEQLQEASKKLGCQPRKEDIKNKRVDFARNSVLNGFESLSKSFFGTFTGTVDMREGTIMEDSMRKKFPDAARSFTQNLSPQPFSFSTKVVDLPMLIPLSVRCQGSEASIAASPDGVVIAGPDFENLSPYLVEFKLLQEKAEEQEIKKTKTFGNCASFHISLQLAVEELNALRSCFREISHLFQTLHHMAVSGCENAVYSCWSACRGEMIRMIMLKADREFLDQYCNEMNVVSRAIFDSDEFLNTNPDLPAIKELATAYLKYEAQHPLKFKDRGIRPTIVSHWNAKKNAQDVLQTELSNLRYLTSRVKANRTLITELLNISLTGAFRCFRAIQIAIGSTNAFFETNGKLKANVTRSKIYDKLNSVGNTQSLVFMLAKQFDPKALSPSSKSKETTKNGQEDPVFEEDPVFKPNDTEFRKYVATTANEIRKAKGGRKSQFQKFLEDEKMNAARLGSATNFQHLKVKSESESTTCVVCCKHCPGGHHTKNKRYGAETKSQCSICLVNLCDFVRAPFTKTCFELFHSILEPPSHPQLRGVSLSFRPNLFPIHSTPDRVASNSSRSRKSKPVSTTQETAQDQVDYSSDESTSSDLDSLSDVYDNSSIDDQQSTTNSNPEDSTRQGSKKMKHDVAPIPLNLDMDDDPNNEDE